jgi:CDP-ribitol ribitolphosphotransferase
MKPTVMIPVFNTESFLPKALDSVLNQTYRGPYEILVVDDGSTDSTPEVIRDYKKRNPGKIKSITHPENRGLTSARNTLLEKAQGDVQIWLDSDDTIAKETLNKIIEYFQKHQEKGFVYSNSNQFDVNGNFLNAVRRNALHPHLEDLMHYFYFTGPIRAFRKSKTGDLRIEDELKIGEDYALVLDIFNRIGSEGMGFIDKALYNCTIRSGSTCDLIDTKTAELSGKSILEKHLKKINFYGDLPFEIIYHRVGQRASYFDHLVEGKSTMKPEVRKVLEEYLTEDGK